MRFKAAVQERTSALAYAIAMLVVTGIWNQTIFNEIVDSEVIRLLDPARVKRLKIIYKYTSKLDDKYLTLFDLLIFISPEIVNLSKNMHEKVNDWIYTNIKKIE